MVHRHHSSRARPERGRQVHNIVVVLLSRVPTKTKRQSSMYSKYVRVMDRLNVCIMYVACKYGI
jgi:hypothetical protein